MMKELSKRILLSTANNLKILTSKIDILLSKDDVDLECKYIALTPAKIKGPNEYFTAMDYALSKKDVRNIAVTGAYGAGKSTIISSYMNTFRKGRYINVSLAGFDLEKKDNASKPQEVELSILQQILYKENRDALPDSRIDRILNRNQSHIKRVFISAFKIALPLGIFLAFIFTDKAINILGVPENIISWFNWAIPFKSVFLLLSFCVSLYFISEFTSKIGIFDKKIKLNKISLLSGDVETGSSDSTSLLNNCLDEMVYFFSKIESYRIVVFEDMDRLKDHDIFVKLREINTIINNNLSEDNPLQFIYAVRDDVFPGAESRTKFFDFIIPVVPVINVSNAYSVLNEKLGKSIEGAQDCLRGTSMYINDMRCLQNIVNEYLIFEKVVDNNNRKINLYSLIFYKNTFSHDYGLIDKKVSVLYRFINDYRHLKLHEEYFLDLQEKVSILSDKMNRVVKEHSNTHQDVREDILRSIIPENLDGIVVIQYTTNNHNFYAYDTKELIDNESSFIDFLESKTKTRVSSAMSTSSYEPGHSYILSETERSALLNDYEERKVLVGQERSKALQNVKTELKEAKETWRRKKAISLSELVSLMSLKQFSDRAESYLNDLATHNFINVEKRTLIRDEMRYGGTDALYLLLSRGFLDQDFMRSRSVFQEGGLSIEDNEFIKDVPLGLSFEMSNEKYVIDDVKGVIDEISAQNFLHFDALLHHQVLDYLLRSGDTRVDDMIAALFNRTGNTILKVLNVLEERFKESESFVLLITRIMDKNHYTDNLITHLEACDESDEKTHLTAFIFSYAKAEWSDNREGFREYIEKIGSRIFHSIESTRLHSFQALIRTLKVRYEKLTTAVNDEEKEFYSFIGEHHLYRLTNNNVGHVLSARLRDHKFTVKDCRMQPWSFASLHDTETQKYFEKEPETFVREVYLESHDTDATAVSAVLHLTPLSDEIKLRIVKEMSFCLDRLTDVPLEPISTQKEKTLSFRDLFYLHDRVYPRWSELLYDFDNGGNRQVLTGFMARHADNLSQKHLNFDNEKTCDSFYENVICNYDLDEESYRVILRDFEVDTSFFDAKISTDIITRLLKNSKIPLNESNYTDVTDLTGFGDEMLEAIVGWFLNYPEEFLADSSFFLKKSTDNDKFEKLLCSVIDNFNFPDECKRMLIIQQADFYLSLTEEILPLSENIQLSVFSLSQDDKFKMKILRSLISSGFRNKTVLASMADKMVESELKKIFTQKTSATLSLNDPSSCIPLFEDLQKAGIVKTYGIREEGKVFITLRDSSTGESE